MLSRYLGNRKLSNKRRRSDPYRASTFKRKYKRKV